MKLQSKNYEILNKQKLRKKIYIYLPLACFLFRNSSTTIYSETHQIVFYSETHQQQFIQEQSYHHPPNVLQVISFQNCSGVFALIKPMRLSAALN